MKTGIIVNPVSGRGVTGRLRAIAALSRHFPSAEIRETTRPGDATVIARDFAEEGVELVIAVGGDGTISDAADGILSSCRPQACLAFVPLGTGSDFVRDFHVPKDIDDLLRAIATTEVSHVDAGRLECRGQDGEPFRRYFINVASLGVSGPTALAANRSHRTGAVGGKALFLFHSIREMLRYRFQDVLLRFDDGEERRERILLVVVANSRWFGGGMKIAPKASLDDGVLDVVVIRAAWKPRLFALMNTIYSGRHLGQPMVWSRQARSVTVLPAADDPANVALAECDGETPGMLPLRIEVLPGALRLKMPRHH
ncbi:diacylglycerol kinase family lipid kinase [Rhizobium sp. ARZ01]|uniref:diacylglycerol/lipid kinase family protein n=1 Tax=Rhizobium sp. ARZ01 TaxID=2769313 RepID=UPI001782E140|nr:diacylglycerol kinase family protein [Rhizobium sp. ARZ01]MBD9371322.1 diacylglycerol kinase family lipid kinase [Rhizobium sp. ARZ01]